MRRHNDSADAEWQGTRIGKEGRTPWLERRLDADRPPRNMQGHWEPRAGESTQRRPEQTPISCTYGIGGDMRHAKCWPGADGMLGAAAGARSHTERRDASASTDAFRGTSAQKSTPRGGHGAGKTRAHVSGAC